MGSLLGAAFSEMRERVADRLLDGERSYRATLLGIRHGTDVVRMFSAAAAAAGHSDLVAWSESWLETRSKLLNEVEREIAWFAAHTERALARAR